MEKLNLEVESYGNYATKGANKKCRYVANGGFKVYYSYDTPIAISYGCELIAISENDWNNTTGIHLNLIDRDKKKRIKHDLLIEKLKEFEEYNPYEFNKALLN